MSPSGNCSCEPEEIFELADRALTPEREREVRAHLGHCPECHDLYERETRLSSCLNSWSFSEPPSVRANVVMALPTRPLKVRLAWALVAGVLLSVALFVLGSNGINPAVFAVDAMAVFWSSTSMITDVLGGVLAAAGGALLAALAFGAVLDLLLAVIFLSVRRRTRQV